MRLHRVEKCRQSGNDHRMASRGTAAVASRNDLVRDHDIALALNTTLNDVLSPPPSHLAPAEPERWSRIVRVPLANGLDAAEPRKAENGLQIHRSLQIIWVDFLCHQTSLDNSELSVAAHDWLLLEPLFDRAPDVNFSAL